MHFHCKCAVGTAFQSIRQFPESVLANPPQAFILLPCKYNPSLHNAVYMLSIHQGDNNVLQSKSSFDSFLSITVIQFSQFTLLHMASLARVCNVVKELAVCHSV